VLTPDNVAQAIGRKVIRVFSMNTKPNCFRPAKNWWLFRCPAPPENATSRRSRSFSRAGGLNLFRHHIIRLSVCCGSTCFRVDIPDANPLWDIAARYPCGNDHQPTCCGRAHWSMRYATASGGIRPSVSPYQSPCAVNASKSAIKPRQSISLDARPVRRTG